MSCPIMPRSRIISWQLCWDQVPVSALALQQSDRPSVPVDSVLLTLSLDLSGSDPGRYSYGLLAGDLLQVSYTATARCG
jgi:hypothetical protein